MVGCLDFLCRSSGRWLLVRASSVREDSVGGVSVQVSRIDVALSSTGPVCPVAGVQFHPVLTEVVGAAKRALAAVMAYLGLLRSVLAIPSDTRADPLKANGQDGRWWGAG